MNSAKIRRDFPILSKKINGQNLIYFDNAATSQKPRQVVAAVSDFYLKSNANIHRGIHALAEEATEIYEKARDKTARFINAKSTKEIIFVRNTTEAVNLVAYSWGRTEFLGHGEIAAAVSEHHSNFVPWQQLVSENSGELKILGLDNHWDLSFDPKSAFGANTRLLALAQASNVTGTVYPVSDLIKEMRGHSPGALAFIDGAQYVAHHRPDTAGLDCDFYAFSAHKMLGPTGIGVLWGREEILNKIPPFNLGGGMIRSVSLEETEYASLPDKFEAGTPAIAEAAGLSAAIDYLESVGFSEIEKQEQALSAQTLEGLAAIPEVTVYGKPGPAGRVPAVSFNLAGIHPHDVAQILNDQYGIAVRAGHHCAMPLHKYLGINASVRASLAFYNTEEEVDSFLNAIKEIIKNY